MTNDSQLNVRIPSDLRRRLAVAAAESGTPIRTIVEMAVEEMLHHIEADAVDLP